MRFQLYLPFFIDRNIYPRLRASNSLVKNIARSVHTYRFETLFHAIFSRFIRETIIRETFSPGESGGWENGKALVRFGRVRWAKRENCHRGLRENRGLPTLVEYTRVSKRSGSSLTKEVGRDASRIARSVVGGVSPTRASFRCPFDEISHLHCGQVRQYRALCTSVTVELDDSASLVKGGIASG